MFKNSVIDKTSYVIIFDVLKNETKTGRCSQLLLPNQIEASGHVRIGEINVQDSRIVMASSQLSTF